MARTKQIKNTTKTTETTKTTMTLEQYQEINAALKETNDVSLYNSETLLQYHLWDLYIKMSDQPDLNLDDFLSNLPLNPQVTQQPAPPEKKKKNTTQEPTDELIIARARYKAMFGKSPGRMKLENIYKKIDNQEPIDSYNEEQFNQDIPDLLKKHQDKSAKKTKRSPSPKKSSPKKNSPKASPTKKKSSTTDPMLKKNPDLDEHLKEVRQKYYSMYGKWPHGKMKIPSILKKIDDAIGDMEPAQPDLQPQDEDIVAQVVDQDLHHDDTTYEKIIYQGVEYTHDSNTGQVFNENHELVAHKDEHGAFIWIDPKFQHYHEVDDDYEAPGQIDDGTETEEE